MKYCRKILKRFVVQLSYFVIVFQKREACPLTGPVKNYRLKG